jgi:hypothetical protein
MKLAKYEKPIFAQKYEMIDGSISYGIYRDLFEKDTDYSFQIKKDKVQRNLYYNEVLYIRQNSTICSVCGKRRWKKDIKLIINPTSFEPIRRCSFCKK